MSKRAKNSLMISLLMALLLSVAGPSLQVSANETLAPEYQVQKNDNLYKIARTQLGSGERWNEIYELNKDIIKDPALIYSGQILRLPDSASDLAEANEEIASDEQKEADQYAQQLIDAASKEEPAVTAALKSLENDKAHLEGLEHRLKTLESISRKILLNAHDMEISIPEASKTINDVLRYTFVIEDSDYVVTTKLITDFLIASGYAVNKFKNYWAIKETEYQGINAVFSTPEGVIFELQFHTPISYYTKGDKTHGYYEIIRSETATEEEKAEASRKQKEAYADVPVPEGVESLSY